MKINHIEKDSIAESIGLKKGDQLYSIDGSRVKDVIDYRFKVADDNIIIKVNQGGELIEYEIEKDIDDNLGIGFDDFNIRACANDCVFCFADQNPPGMREGLYFRDGDYRMSYLYGHYITMTNMGKNELKRIVEQRLSPLYISVHTTDVALRKELLLYKGKDDFLIKKIKYLIDNDIELHGQVVLIPGKNDGKYLLKTLSDLYKFYPKFKTLSIVPVGLTRHREGLPELRYVSENYAVDLFEYFPQLRSKFPGFDNSPFVLLADEWYILAKKDFPLKEEYGNYDLIENGVGQFRFFLDQLNSEKNKFPKSIKNKKKISIVTGELAYDTFVKKVKPIFNNIKNLEVKFYKIKNNFFGDSVTVAGLLTGRDIIEQLKDKDLGDCVWTTYRILNDDQTLTLDDMTLEDISKALGIPLKVSNDSINEVIEKTLNE